MKKQLDLNNPTEAREFLTKALPEALPTGFNEVILEGGHRLAVKDMDDYQVVQYAWELLPIYQAAFPESVDVQREH